MTQATATKSRAMGHFNRMPSPPNCRGVVGSSHSNFWPSTSPSIMPMAMAGSMESVMGTSKATPMVAVKPGSAPKVRPMNVPAKTISMVIGSDMVAKVWERIRPISPILPFAPYINFSRAVIKISFQVVVSEKEPVKDWLGEGYLEDGKEHSVDQHRKQQ